MRQLTVKYYISVVLLIVNIYDVYYDVPLDKRVDAKSKFRQLAKLYHVEGGIVEHGDKEV